MTDGDEFPVEAAASLVRAALQEDLGAGDVTGTACVPVGVHATGVFVAKQSGTISGLPVAELVFQQIDPAIEFAALIAEGTHIDQNGHLATITGCARSILAGERVALNFLQRLSGIATATARYVERARKYGTQILDTRKTTPGLRALEKYAVRCGGGRNHRLGLYDQVLIKDNHLDVLAAECGGRLSAIEVAIRRGRQAIPSRMRIEVEVECLEEAVVAARCGADIIMLDNMSCADMTAAVDAVRACASGEGPTEEHSGAVIEASGGITLDRVDTIAQTGVDWISVGGLTHSVVALDVSLDLAFHTATAPPESHGPRDES